MSKASSIKKPLFIFAVLFFPSMLYVALSSGKHNMMQLPFYGPKEVIAPGDTNYFKIPDFSFVNQQGKTITKKEVEGKILVIDFFFTTCQSICPKMTELLTRVQYKMRETDDVVILSHTVNPGQDSVEVMAAYGESYHVDHEMWHLLTGSKEALYKMARKGYFLTALEGDGGDDDFIHSEKLVLVDKQGRIRGYYDGTQREDVDKLIDEIKLLQAWEQSVKMVGKKKK